MPVARFSRYLLRTTDVEAASAFYDAVLGHRGDGIVLLHEAALARGARPHWLGHVGVQQLGGREAVAARFVERGAERLGPPVGVGDFVILRDPNGVIGAVYDANAAKAESQANVLWHQLNTQHPEGAAANYQALFGWSFTTKLELGSLGSHQHFAFSTGDTSCGIVSDIQGRPEVHPHWLFYFGVPSLDNAVARARELGASVAGVFTLPGGARIAVCDDPQGAAFGLVEPQDAARLAQAAG